MKRVQKIIFSVVLACLSICFVVGCGNKDNGSGNNPDSTLTVEQVFSKWESVYKETVSSMDSLTINIGATNFSGQNKEQMNTDGYWPETSSETKSYDSQTGLFFSSYQMWENSRVDYVSKSFEDELGYFQLSDGVPYESLLIDKQYGAFKIRDGIVNVGGWGSIFDDHDWCFISYDLAKAKFEEVKARDVNNNNNCEVSYSFLAKKVQENYVIEANYSKLFEEMGSEGLVERKFILTFNENSLLKFEKIDEHSDVMESWSWYTYSKIDYSFSNQFDQEQYNQIQKDSLSKPHNKIVQDLKIVVDGQMPVAYSCEFGTAISEFVSQRAVKENSKGYKVYLDDNYTLEYTNQVTKSYEPTFIYLVSIPDDDYANVITRFIYQKASGERSVDWCVSQIVSAIDYTVPDDPWEGTVQVLSNTYNHCKYFYEKIYINNVEADNNNFVAMPGEVYFVDVVHKQDTTPVVLKLYDKNTGELWQTLTQYEKGVFWEYIENQIKNSTELNYYGIELNRLGLSFYRDSNGENVLSARSTLDKSMDIYVSFGPPVAGVLLLNKDLSSNHISASVGSANYNQFLRYYLDEYETLIIDGVEIKVDGVVLNTNSLTERLSYDSQINMIKVRMSTGRIIIKFKYSAGL